MPDEHPFTLRQVDLARADFAAIADDLDSIKAQLARVPTRKELARTALGVIFCSAALVIPKGALKKLRLAPLVRLAARRVPDPLDQRRRVRF